mmetsp:Transcript_167888/g.539252  ORF Transcript_167888/g.539252 Transcript_167888/m.539252 type:complete len:224 (-) Transcript_167888:442-1113(-)
MQGRDPVKCHPHGLAIGVVALRKANANPSNPFLEELLVFLPPLLGNLLWRAVVEGPSQKFLHVPTVNLAQAHRGPALAGARASAHEPAADLRVLQCRQLSIVHHALHVLHGLAEAAEVSRGGGAEAVLPLPGVPFAEQFLHVRLVGLRVQKLLEVLGARNRRLPALVLHRRPERRWPRAGFHDFAPLLDVLRGLKHPPEHRQHLARRDLRRLGLLRLELSALV